jgi:hypothetical protein
MIDGREGPLNGRWCQQTVSEEYFKVCKESLAIEMSRME